MGVQRRGQLMIYDSGKYLIEVNEEVVSMKKGRRKAEEVLNNILNNEKLSVSEKMSMIYNIRAGCDKIFDDIGKQHGFRTKEEIAQSYEEEGADESDAAD